MLPVLTADAWALPTAVRLAVASGDLDLGLAIGDEVVLDADGLHLPRVTVRPVRTWRPARVPAGRRRTGAVTLRPVRHQPGDDLAAGLRRALQAADPTPHVHDLVGRGPGLTPSGDDVLAGALLVLRALGVPSPLPDVVREASHRTTTLSASLLDAAAEGYAVPQVVEHVRRVTAAAPGRDPGAAGPDPSVASRRTVERIGHWSGRDLLTGIDTTLEVCAPPRTPPVRRATPLTPHRRAS